MSSRFRWRSDPHVESDIDRLSAEFVGAFSPETVRRYLAESLDEWSEARIALPRGEA
jgi:hypothetical protein